MKRTILIYSLLFVITPILAKEKSEHDNKEESNLYFTTELNLSGGNFRGWGKPDFGIDSFTLGLGYRIDDNWSIWMPVSTDLLLINKQSTRNYLDQGTIGLGAGYSINMKDHKAIGFNLSAGSTYLNYEVDYLKIKAAVSLGYHHLEFSPYVSIGCTYFKPYSGMPDDVVMYEVTIGFSFF